MADEEENSGAPLINTNVNVNASDLIGFGAAANTPAGKAIGEAVSSGLIGFLRATGLLLFGDRLTRVEANRITTLATAEGQARLISTEYDEAIRSRAGLRLINEESRRQNNIEEAAKEAILIADKSSKSEEPIDLSDEFVLNWIDGVKDAHSSTVRTMWAHLLASQASGSSDKVRGPALSLLKSLDGGLAEAFRAFSAFMLVYGCYPNTKAANPNKLSVTDLGFLKEIGFIYEDNFKKWGMREFSARIDIGKFGGLHTAYRFTHRAWSLLHSIFGADPWNDGLSDLIPKQSEVVATYIELISAMIESEKQFGLCLSFPEESESNTHEIVFSGNATPNIPYDDVVVTIGETSQLMNPVRSEVLQTLCAKFEVKEIRRRS